MSQSKDRKPNRGGETASSSADLLEELRTPMVALGDIADLYAYVCKIARPLASDEDELEELISHGMGLAFERFSGLGEGKRLSEALSFWLESRLRDYLRKEHREIRRNSRAGTTYTLPSPTGLAWEHSGMTATMLADDDARLIDSRLALQLFTRKEDLYDPRLIGRYLRVPSAAGLPPGVAAEVWAAIEEERAHTKPKPFPFLKHDEFE